MRRRARDREHTRELVGALHAVCDALRSGASLRSALLGAAGEEPSPFAPVAASLRAGRPLVPVLHGAAAALAAGASATDRDLASACCVLAVHAEAGGDPLPACRSVADRIAQRDQAAEEARALTTQSRLGARTILLMTPAFLGLLAVSDPRAVTEWARDPKIRTAIVAGLALQLVGSWWISAIVRAATGAPSRASRIPFMRAVHALMAGRRAAADDADVAATAEVVALVLEAGVSPTAALSAAAPHAAGPFGEALRAAVLDTDVALAEALDRCAVGASGDAAERFVRSVRAATELGVPLAPPMLAIADDVRERTRVRLAGDIRRASVRVLVPLGVLVLPAFVLACLIPLFVGGLSNLAGM